MLEFHVRTVWATAKGTRSSPPFVDGAGNRVLVTVAADASMDALVMEPAVSVGPEPANSLISLFDAVIGPLQEAKQIAEQAV